MTLCGDEPTAGSQASRAKLAEAGLGTWLRLEFLGDTSKVTGVADL